MRHLYHWGTCEEAAYQLKKMVMAYYYNYIHLLWHTYCTNSLYVHYYIVNNIMSISIDLCVYTRTFGVTVFFNLKVVGHVVSHHTLRQLEKYKIPDTLSSLTLSLPPPSISPTPFPSLSPTNLTRSYPEIYKQPVKFEEVQCHADWSILFFLSPYPPTSLSLLQSLSLTSPPPSLPPSLSPLPHPPDMTIS